MTQYKDVEEIVKQILKTACPEVKPQGKELKQQAAEGVFNDVNSAIEAAAQAQRELRGYSLTQRNLMIASIRRALLPQVEKLAAMAVEETGMGRYDHKVLKNKLAIEKSPGVEDLATEVSTGDGGMTLYERAPYGVIGSITPSTNPTETIICNAIGMIAAGNSVMFSPHPGAKGVSSFTVQVINRAIQEAGGPANLVTTIAEPSLEATDDMLRHPKIRLICATGGPAIVEKALSSGKKAIGAGAGNPPAVVDETADIHQAARDIVDGCSFDNNLPCIAEKEVIAVNSIADRLKEAMTAYLAYEITDRGLLKRLEQLVLNEKGTINKNYVGKDAAHIMECLGVDIGDNRVILVEVEQGHPFVQEELMMPILPLVRAQNVEEAIEIAVQVEHGNRHTAIMHSKNVDHLTKMARALETTIFVKNGPSYAGIGYGAEGHCTFTIAGPTGEGLTSAKTFTRIRRCVMHQGLSIK